MSIKDVIKSSIYERIGGGNGLSFGDISLIMILACLMGIYVFFLYKNTSKAGFYSKELNLTIAGMPIIIAALMIAMQSNLLVSLGMVGALSIVRFRTAIKNPLDLLYLFWTISLGIICGVGLYALAFVLAGIMTLLIMLLQLTPNVRGNSILVLRSSKEVDWKLVNQLIGDNCKHHKEKSRVIKNGITEVIMECSVNDEEKLVKAINESNTIESINVLSHDGMLRV